MIIRVTGKFGNKDFCAGIIVGRNSTCVIVAPILHWASGRQARYVRNYCRNKGWKVEEMYNDGKIRDRRQM
jgi:hypothetical protein